MDLSQFQETLQKKVTAPYFKESRCFKITKLKFVV